MKNKKEILNKIKVVTERIITLNKTGKLKYPKIILWVLIFVFALNLLFPLKISYTYSKAVYSSENVLLTAYLTKDDKWRLYTSLNEVSPILIKAIIEKEDKWFYWHPGFNLYSIGRALISNLFFQKRMLGASTITMQVIRMNYPAERTYFSKFYELIRAVQLELNYSKKEILEMYLSKLPYGGNIEGVKSASYIYFNQSPQKLSLAQAVMLACIPNNPNKFRLDKSVENAKNFRNRFLKYFLANNTFTKEEVNDALNEPINKARYSIPNITPHYSYYISKLSNEHNIKTTLKYLLQEKAEQLLKNYVDRAKAKFVNNGAVIIIDNKTMNVVAYCGSSDFYDFANSGQVDGVVAVRSPGSALKPALFALGFDMGIITPKSKLLDIPFDFGGYAPENYDLKFNGEVTTEFALVNSLNLPAVRLLKSVSMESFLKLLSNAGFYEINRSKSKLGLSVILGGCGVRLDEMVRLYSSFANKGKLYELRYLQNDEKETNVQQILSNESVYLISDILSKNVRPDFPSEMIDMTGRPKIAWKTGTSFGKRDAWAIGYNPDYTIGVWVGNFNGVGSPHLSGAEMAVPLLFDLFNIANKSLSRKRQIWFDTPTKLGTRKVCSETGLIPDDDCSLIIDDYYIKGVSTKKVCDLYKETYVSNDETIEYCVSCLPKDGYKKKKYPFYDPELLIWYDENNVMINRPPKHNPACTVRLSDEGPRIISPMPDYEYYLEKGEKQQILLQAASQLNTNFHYWYANNIFLGKLKSNEKLFFVPKKGKNFITCMDDKGRTSEVVIMVRYY